MAVIEGASSNNKAEVLSDGHLKVVPEIDASTNPQFVGAIKLFSENDLESGDLSSPETDQDWRLKTANDTLLDSETFNYTAQNTGKHTYTSTTLTFTFGTGGLTTNGANVTTTSIGATFGTYAEFDILPAHSIYCEVEGGFTNQPVSNCTIDFGMFRRGVTTQFAPTDGVYFRLNASGMFGVVNNNGSETPTASFKIPGTTDQWIYTENHKYQFIITINQRVVQFWIDGEKYGEIKTPNSQGQPFMSSSLPFSVRHAHSGTTSGFINMNINNYSVLLGGSQYAETLGSRGNAIHGAYQGLSGGTMGGLTNYTNSTNPTPAVPVNTELTTNLPTGLGGQAWETVTTALNTDVILMSYQNPAGTVSVKGKRLKIRGVKMTAFVQKVIAGGAWVNTFALAFGHTAVSLATAEATNTKKPRIVLLPELTQAVTAKQAVSTIVSQPYGGVSYFEEPVYVNPGEFVQFTMKRIGTIGTSGTIAYNIQYDYSWE